jgi:antitoxin Phd
MKSWAVQDAKNQLSQVIDLAQAEGPQTITRHGKPVVVVMAAKEFKKLTTPKETPLQFFSRLRGTGVKFPKYKDLPRKIEF